MFTQARHLPGETPSYHLSERRAITQVIVKVRGCHKQRWKAKQRCTDGEPKTINAKRKLLHAASTCILRQKNINSITLASNNLIRVTVWSLSLTYQKHNCVAKKCVWPRKNHMVVWPEILMQKQSRNIISLKSLRHLNALNFLKNFKLTFSQKGLFSVWLLPYKNTRIF